MRALHVAAFVLLLLAAAGGARCSSEATASAVGVDIGDAAPAALQEAAAGGSPLTTNSSGAGARPAAGQQQARPGRRPQEEVLADLYAENEWKNDLILWILPDGLRAKLPHAAQVRARGGLRAPPPARWPRDPRPHGNAAPDRGGLARLEGAPGGSASLG